MRPPATVASSSNAAAKPIPSAMFALDRFLLLIRDLRRNERGIALPVAMFAMIGSMALAGAAVVSSVNVQVGSKRDSGAKAAISARSG